VWQPHTYSRTKTLLGEFAQAFDAADHVVVLPIYASRERDTLGISSADVLAAMCHPDVRCARSLDEALVWLGTEARPGDVVLTLGAGDQYQVGEWLLEVLRDGQSPPRDEASDVSEQFGIRTEGHGDNGARRST
jgi:UDP-N-acetylmuramate--alanine ligase